MTTIRVNRTGSTNNGLSLTAKNAQGLVRSRIVNYSGPYLVISNGSSAEESFSDAEAAVLRALELLKDAPLVTVYPASKPQAGFDLISASKPKPIEEAMAQLDDRDELMPREVES